MWVRWGMWVSGYWAWLVGFTVFTSNFLLFFSFSDFAYNIPGAVVWRPGGCWYGGCGHLQLVMPQQPLEGCSLQTPCGMMQQRGDRLPDVNLSDGQKLKLMELATGMVKFKCRNINHICNALGTGLNLTIPIWAVYSFWSVMTRQLSIIGFHTARGSIAPHYWILCIEVMSACKSCAALSKFVFNSGDHLRLALKCTQ